MRRSASWCLIVGLGIALLVVPATASDTQWNINLQAHYQVIGGPPSDPVQYMGIRSGATDDYDATLDRAKPLPPMGDYVYLYWYRSGWGSQTDYAQDWRAVITSGTTKTWPDLRLSANVSGNIIIKWVFDTTTGWEIPANYRLTLYNEGTGSNPGGGTPVDMRTNSQTTVSYTVGQTHYFHITVQSLIPPTCNVTYTPASPIPGQMVSFDSHAADSDGSVASVSWTFGDSGTGSGITTTHAYSSTGTFTVSCTVTDNDGITTVCSTSVIIAGCGNDNQWNIKLGLYSGTLGGSPMDYNDFLGVRSGATDGYNSAYDSAKPSVPMPPMVYLFWYRTGWGTGNNYLADYRSALADNQTKVWQDLRAQASPGDQTLVLSWTLGAGGTAWSVPCDYTVTVFDEGTSPNPTGGSPLDARASSQLSFSYGDTSETHYFHFAVCHGVCNVVPTCNISYSPAAPIAQQAVAFDSQASDTDGTVVSASWTFGDGNTGSGLTTSHAYTTAGTYTINCTVTDNGGSTGSCSTSVVVIDAVTFTLAGGCWHMLSLPCDPANPDPTVVFPLGTLLGTLSRYETNVGYITYDEFDPDAFGPMQAGVGYWLNTLDPITVSYGASCPTVTQEMAAPTAGWHMIGSHQNGDVSLFNVSVRNNTLGQTKLFEEAWLGGWVQDPLQTYTCAILGYETSGVDFTDIDSYLRQYKGYWFATQEPNLTLIVPTP